MTSPRSAGLRTAPEPPGALPMGPPRPPGAPRLPVLPAGHTHLHLQQAVRHGAGHAAQAGPPQLDGGWKREAAVSGTARPPPAALVRPVSCPRGRSVPTATPPPGPIGLPVQSGRPVVTLGARSEGGGQPLDRAGGGGTGVMGTGKRGRPQAPVQRRGPRGECGQVGQLILFLSGGRGQGSGIQTRASPPPSAQARERHRDPACKAPHTGRPPPLPRCPRLQAPTQGQGQAPACPRPALLH